MKKYLPIPVLVLFVVSLWNVAWKDAPSIEHTHETSLADNPFVVVELFTSQGCSSCPPADRLLTQLYKKAEEEGKQIIPLSFHVAYWNYLGWKDPFSREAFSTRQRTYAKQLRSGVYTPQMVFNGKDEGVGSKSAQVLSKVDKQLQYSSNIPIKVTQQLYENKVEVSFELESVPATSDVNIALVERDLELYVQRGENGGRTLKHDNVVRTFKTVRLEKENNKSKVTLPVPNDVDLKNASIVVYAQGKQQGEIYAATMMDIMPAK